MRRQVQQLFQNIISNALKYSKPGTPPVIEIHAPIVTEQARSYHMVAVQDNGIGFDNSYNEQIFKMFTRLHGKSEYTGTGIGLSIVKKVIENHDGFIRAQSEPDNGALFQIFWPV